MCGSGRDRRPARWFSATVTRQLRALGRPAPAREGRHTVLRGGAVDAAIDLHAVGKRTCTVTKEAGYPAGEKSLGPLVTGSVLSIAVPPARRHARNGVFANQPPRERAVTPADARCPSPEGSNRCNKGRLPVVTAPVAERWRLCRSAGADFTTSRRPSTVVERSHGNPRLLPGGRHLTTCEAPAGCRCGQRAGGQRRNPAQWASPVRLSVRRASCAPTSSRSYSNYPPVESPTGRWLSVPTLRRSWRPAGPTFATGLERGSGRRANGLVPQARPRRAPTRRGRVDAGDAGSG